MQTIGAYEAKTHLPRLLDEVAKGSCITITKRGVAVLVPVTGPPRSDPAVAVDEMQRWQREHRLTLGSASLRTLIQQGRI
jgi:prevent-host-death family protein